MSTKRSKGPNFSPTETKILVGLVKKHCLGVTCNKTDEKREIRRDAWEEIANEFNISANNVGRTANALKNKYKNIKAASSKKISDLKSYTRGTGGGPPKIAKITPLDEIIREIHGPQIEGMPSEFDGDRETRNEEELDDEDDPEQHDELFMDVTSDLDIDYSLNQIIIEEEDDNNLIPTATETSELTTIAEEPSKWNSYNPKKLKQQKSAALKVKRNSIQTAGNKEKSSKTKLNSWAKSKVELSELQKKFIIQQHNEKLKNIQDPHKREMGLLEQESNERRQWTKEEHLLRMEILQLQKNKIK